VSRHYAIERDNEDRAARLLWPGDTPDAKRRGASECGFCGASLPQNGNPGSPRKHCSPEHRRAAWDRDHPRIGTQRALDWTPRAEPAVPPSDPGIPAPVRKRAISLNRALLARLLDGTHIRSDEAQQIAGKRYSARLSDVRSWLRGLGYVGDPLPVRCLDGEARMYSWRLTGAAIELAQTHLR